VHHQHTDLNDLRDKVSQVITSTEAINSSVAHSSRHIHSLISDHRETQSTLASVASNLDNGLPKLNSAIQESTETLVSIVNNLEAKIESYTTQSSNNVAELVSVCEFTWNLFLIADSPTRFPRVMPRLPRKVMMILRSLLPKSRLLSRA
jgi:uncharacterized phage infection (PIP) family protein YhgE